jgi:large repetitive protein
VTYWSVDNAGNVEQAHTFTPQIDLAAPVTTATASPSGWTNGSVTLTLTATDTGGSGVNATYYVIGGGAQQIYSAPVVLSAATAVTYWSVDNVGNIEQAHTFTPQIDTMAPITTAAASPSSGWTNGTVALTLTATDSGGSGVKATYYKIGTGAQQTYSAPLTLSDATPVTYWSVDNAGNVEQAHTFTPQIDTKAPVTTATVCPSGWTKCSVTLTLSATDSGGSGLKATYYKIDGGSQQTYTKPITLTSSATVTYWSVDNAGNVEQAHTFAPQIDTTPPVTTAAASPSGWTNGSVTLTLSATDTGGSGVEATYYKIGCGTQQTYTKPLVLSDATPVTYWSVDNVGNVEQAHTFTPQIDTSPPMVTITAPVSCGSYKLGQVVKASWTATDALSGINAALTGSTPVANGAAIDTSSVGQKTFTVTATDNAGNVTTKTVTYTVTQH